MANALQLRRGTTTQHSTFTGLAGEVTVDTDKETIVVHDGSTAGGFPLALESDITAASLLTSIKTVDGAASGLDADTVDGKQLATIESEYQAYADSAAAGIVDSAPSTLDTLNELAAALGDDPNFATTVTNSIATKLSTSGGTISGQLTVSTASDNKILLKTPSGDSSDWNYIEFIGRDNVRDGYVGTAGDGTLQLYSDYNSSYLELGGVPTINGHTVWTAGNDGASSGLDADMLDGLHASTFLRGDVDDAVGGIMEFGNAILIEEVVEKVATSATTSGTINFDVRNAAVNNYSTNQTANRTINFRASSSQALNSFLDTGKSVTVTALMAQGSTAYYLNAYQVDGSAVTPKWSGGSAPTGGNASGIDVYTFTIIKTANATFTVLASVTQYA